MTDITRDLIRERLDELSAKNGGRVTPEAVVEDAKKPTSPLHSEFTWNVKEAAHEYWIEQARRLIRSVRIVVQTETTTIRTVAYLRDPSAESDEQGYVSVESLRGNAESSKEALRYEFSRAEAVLQRARDLAVALSLENEVDRIIDDIHAVTELVA